MELRGLRCTFLPSLFKLVLSHFYSWWLLHLMGSGQQVHACNGALLQFLHGAKASVVFHTSTQLCNDFSSPLVPALQKSTHWRFTEQLRHFKLYDPQVVLFALGLPIPSWPLASSRWPVFLVFSWEFLVPDLLSCGFFSILAYHIWVHVWFSVCKASHGWNFKHLIFQVKVLSESPWLVWDADLLHCLLWRMSNWQYMLVKIDGSVIGFWLLVSFLLMLALMDFTGNII